MYIDFMSVVHDVQFSRDIKRTGHHCSQPCYYLGRSRAPRSRDVKEPRDLFKLDEGKYLVMKSQCNTGGFRELYFIATFKTSHFCVSVGQLFSVSYLTILSSILDIISQIMSMQRETAVPTTQSC